MNDYKMDKIVSNIVDSDDDIQDDIQDNLIKYILKNKYHIQQQDANKEDKIYNVFILNELLGENNPIVHHYQCQIVGNDDIVNYCKDRVKDSGVKKDKTLIEQYLVNVLINGIKNMEQGSASFKVNIDGMEMDGVQYKNLSCITNDCATEGNFADVLKSYTEIKKNYEQQL